MKANQSLFELIKSLSMSEKRYFKLQVALQKGNKIYLKLFREIDSQTEYNERKIKEKFSGEKFVRQLAFTKNYLYKMIMRSLISFRNEKTADIRILEQINSCKILLEKGLLRQYFVKLNYTMKIAVLYERFNYCMQILEMRNFLTKISIYKYNTSKFSINTEDLLKQINNFHEYSRLFTTLIDIYRDRGKIRHEDLNVKVNEIGKHPLLRDPSAALSFRAREIYFYVWQIICDFKGEEDLQYEYCNARLQLIIDHPEPFSDMNINSLYDVLGYILFYNARKLNKSKFNYYLKFLNSIPVRSRLDETEQFFANSYAKIVKCISEKAWSEGLKLIPVIKEKMELYKVNLEVDKEVLILYRIIEIEVMAGKYKEALNDYNILWNNSNLKLRSDIEWYLKLMNLIIHYELGNYKLLKHFLISTYRSLYCKNKLFKVESSLFNFIRRLTGVNSDKQLKLLLFDLKRELHEIKKDNFERNAFRYFDFIYWLDTKLQ